MKLTDERLKESTKACHNLLLGKAVLRRENLSIAEEMAVTQELLEARDLLRESQKPSQNQIASCEHQIDINNKTKAHLEKWDGGKK